MMKLRIALASRLPLYLLMVGLITLHACKNKKKLAEITDQEAATEQIEQELAEADQEPEEEPAVEEEQNTRSNASNESQSAGALSRSMTAISNANSVGLANQSIRETLSMFSTKDAPVLIIIYENGSEVDYDEPTTIEKYLNYLKDTKSKPAEIVEIGRDPSGKIKELVLRK